MNESLVYQSADVTNSAAGRDRDRYHKAIEHLHYWLTFEQGFEVDPSTAVVDAVESFQADATQILGTRARVAITGVPVDHGKVRLEIVLLWPDEIASLSERDRRQQELTTLYDSTFQPSPAENLEVATPLFRDEVPEVRPPAHFIGIHGLTTKEEAKAKRTFNILKKHTTGFRAALGQASTRGR